MAIDNTCTELYSKSINMNLDDYLTLISLKMLRLAHTYFNLLRRFIAIKETCDELCLCNHLFLDYDQLFRWKNRRLAQFFTDFGRLAQTCSDLNDNWKGRQQRQYNKSQKPALELYRIVKEKLSTKIQPISELTALD